MFLCINFQRKTPHVDPALFIARRMTRVRCSERPGIMERIAVVSVAVSVAVMILALAVMMGFKREVTHRIAGFAGHATLTDVRSLRTPDAHSVLRTPQLEELIRSTEGFVSMAPYAVRGGIVRTDRAVEGVLLKGIDAAYDCSLLGAWLEQGALPRVGDSLRTKDLLISRTLAQRLSLGVGDRVEMLFPASDARPRRDRFKVSGIYSSGMDEMDRALVVTDLRNVQRLSDWGPDRITGYEIFTREIGEADGFARRLNHALLYDESGEMQNLVVQSVRDLYANLFDWLRAHDVNAAVVIAVMLAVAFFNMATALLVLVLERTRMIGLLKALGMGDAALRRIFLYRAAFVALRGMAWGNAAGLGLCLLQLTTHAVKLNAEGYLLSEVPIALEWSWWLPLNAGALAAIVALLVIPSHILSTVKPDQTIRYE